MPIDTKQLTTVDGFDLRVELHSDPDGKPTDFDCYNDVDLQAWENDMWEFVGVVVIASRRGHDLGQASLWNVEHGWFPGDFDGPVGEMFVNALSRDDEIEDLAGEALAWARLELSALVS